MLTKCANPSCSASFRHLQDGRLFLLEADLTLRSSEVKAPEYSWLYKACSVKMTLRLAPDGIVMATGLRKALRKGPQPTLFSANREAGLLLRRVTFLRSSHRESDENPTQERHATDIGMLP
jgi:hypothetical protein